MGFEAPSSSHWRVPERVGRYEIILPIASGGMATVYLARSIGARGFERLVALKLSHTHLSESRDYANIILEEAKLASRIRHRNVVSVLDVDEDPAGLFLVMDYVEGATVAGLNRSALRDGETLPMPIAARLILDSLAGLHAVHEAQDDHGKPLGIVHRDFSPQNILVSLDGVAELTDFGIAKASDAVTHTATGTVKGKTAYMAPEQARALPLDRRADIWSAGVVLWEMLTGRRLYEGTDGIATLLRLISDTPPRLRSVRSDISPELDQVVAEALMVDRENRIANAALFARRLNDAFMRDGAIADAEEVGTYVRNAVRETIASRREKVLAISQMQSGEHPIVEDVTSALTDTTATSDSPTRPRRSFWIGGAVLIAAVGLVAAGAVYRAHLARLAPQTVAAAPALSITEPAPSASAETPTVVRTHSEIRIESSVPLASIHVNDRRVAFTAPSRAVTFDREGSEIGASTVVVAIAQDGRQSRTNLAPDASVLKIEFSHPPAAPQVTVKKKMPGLAPNPYGGQ